MAAPSDIVFNPHITHITAASGRVSFENKLAQKGSKVGRRQRSEGLAGFGTGPPSEKLRGAWKASTHPSSTQAGRPWHHRGPRPISGSEPGASAFSFNFGIKGG